MKERPILFQGPMVRALLACTKTQTRRAVKLGTIPQHAEFSGWQDHRGQSAAMFSWEIDQSSSGFSGLCCPYGEPGDRLWVRESWGYFDPDGSGEDYDRDRNSEGGSGPCKSFRPEMLQEGHALRDYWRRRVAYKATFAEQKYGMGPVGPAKWRPSIHMPRWASRILLEVTGVRVERLQQMHEPDALAEGYPRDWMPGGDGPWCSPMQWYADLWKDINGAGSWDANPWVWAVSFKRAEA